ncbi:efflux RND transporter permease subunit [Nannocystis pusilla]|uniref:efflux RND transporter permease subunit n=1 Tax=Nannocystis pusilla TaxID=889268 RepID=UPI003B836104
MQALPEFRALPPDVLKMWVKNEAGEMVPYSSFMTLRKRQGPNEITRYNMYNSSAIRGNNAPGYTTGDAVNAIKAVAAEVLPRGYDIAWEGLSYDEARRGNEAIYIFGRAGVRLSRARGPVRELRPPARRDHVAPAGAFGSFLFLQMMGLANDIYAQVGLVMLVGLLGKNAVLIVEFAVQTRRDGATVFEAAVAGAKARFRAILMTSFAFVAGLYPLVVAKGAGAVGNNTIGSSALGGMVMGTVFGVVLIPGSTSSSATSSGSRSSCGSAGPPSRRRRPTRCRCPRCRWPISSPRPSRTPGRRRRCTCRRPNRRRTRAPARSGPRRRRTRTPPARRRIPVNKRWSPIFARTVAGALSLSLGCASILGTTRPGRPTRRRPITSAPWRRSPARASRCRSSGTSSSPIRTCGRSSRRRCRTTSS